MTELEQLLQQAEHALSALMMQNERERLFAVESRRRFERNIQAFEKYFPDIAKIIKEYIPSEEFQILVTSTGVGNFIPSHADVPIYSDNPIEQTKQQIKKNTANGYYSLTSYGFSANDQDLRLHVQYMKRLSNVIKKFDDRKLEQLKILPKHFPTAMIFGVGLGYCVTELFKEHAFDYVFINEPDLEVFYASLFCTDWVDIVNKAEASTGALFFQIGLPVDEFLSAISQIAIDIGAFSIVRTYCYQHYPSMEVNKQIHEFFNRYFEFQLGFGFYNDAITGLAHCVSNLSLDVNLFLNEKKKNYIDFPVVVVGNGSSLDSVINVLKEIQDKVIIFACGTALGSLHRYGVKADFHVLVERTKSTHDALIDMLDAREYAKLNLLTVDVMHPDVVQMYKWVGMGLKGPESATVFTQVLMLEQFHKKMPSLPYCGPLVANTGLSFAYSLGFSEIYLLGVDNGYIAGKTHSEQSIYKTVDRYSKRAKKNGNNGSAINVGIQLKGNLHQDVVATNMLALAKIQMEKLLKTDRKITVYNVGEGAFINGALPLDIDDVFLSSKANQKTDVIERVMRDHFKHFKLNVNEGKIGFELFEKICDDLNQIATEPFSCRMEASDILRRQARYLYAYRQTRFSHLFNVIKGSLLYYHCPMLTLLYKYEDEKECLNCFSELMNLWVAYVNEMKSDFRVNWNKSCNYDMELHLSRSKNRSGSNGVSKA